MKIIHCSDLHVSSNEKDYCISVLEEIVDITVNCKAAVLLISGDFFDTFDDAEALRSEIHKIFERLPEDLRIIFLPGNHDVLRAGKRSLERLEFGRVELHSARPYSLIDFEDCEILCIPYQKSYQNYINWDVPEKKRPLRITAAHGPVAGLNYLGPKDEGDTAVLDPDLFSRFSTDYAALGHIHNSSAVDRDGCFLSFPGSARVWRRNENGPRILRMIDTEQRPIRPEDLVIEKSGQYRSVRVEARLDGSLPDLDTAGRDWAASDFVELRIEGVVEDEHTVMRSVDLLRSRYAEKVRELSIDTEGISALPGITGEEIARRFLSAWEKRKPETRDPEKEEIWLRSRQIGLREIKSVLEARK
jgi:DNA repair exonuclease SbcCD nuclease subunit